MNMRLVFFAILLFLYFIQDIALSMRFKKKFNRKEYFLGRNASDDVPRYFGKVIYIVFFYYFINLIYLITGFTFWGLISYISILEKRYVWISGFVLSVIFLLMMVQTRLNLGSSWRIGLDYEAKEDLITYGFYRFIRNPYYTFLLGFQFSLILIIPNAIMIFSFIQSFILLGLQARQEETFLQKKHGDKYIIYKSKTGRFFPKLNRRK